jgi:hypothetical protein
MGKNATPKVAIDAKNHMENHIFLSVSILTCVVISVQRVNVVPDSVHSQSL